MADQQKIIALVFFENGRQSFEEAYDENISIDEYIARFEKETKRMNPTNWVSMGFIRVTEHNDDGSFKRDEDGQRIEKYLYDKRRF